MRLFWLTLLTAGLVSSAFASGVNIKLSGNQDPLCGPPYICVSTDSFVISVDDLGGGFFDAVNGQTGPITQLNFDLAYEDSGCPSGAPTPVQLNLDSSFLQFATNSLSVTSNSVCDTSQSGVADYLLNLSFTNGIPQGFLFQIGLNSDGTTDPNGAGGWVPEQDSVVTTATPEPRYSAALAAGLLLIGAFAAYRRRYSS